MGGLLHYFGTAIEEGPGRAGAVPNVTAHPSTASVPTSYYWHYNCLCTKGLITGQWQFGTSVQ